MKKLLMLFLSFSCWANAGDFIPKEVYNITKNPRLSIYESDKDEKKAIVLALPPFNIKTNDFEFVMKLFGDVGIPGFLLSFSGCSDDEQNCDMNQKNWEGDVDNAIKGAVDTAKRLKRKLIIFGHSMGGLYGINGLHRFEDKGWIEKNVSLVLLAPADGLKPLKNILHPFVSQNSLFSMIVNSLSINNKECLNALYFLRNQIISLPLGTMICGPKAAQTHLPFSAFQALINSSVDVKYPDAPTILFYRTHDGLMDATFFAQGKYPNKNCISINLDECGYGIQKDPTLAHTFEDLKDNKELADMMMKKIVMTTADNYDHVYELNKIIEENITKVENTTSDNDLDDLVKETLLDEDEKILEEILTEFQEQEKENNKN